MSKTQSAQQSRFTAWAEHNKFCLRDAWSRQRKELGRSIITWVVIGFSLWLPTVLYALLVQLEPLLEQSPTPQLNIYLEQDLTSSEIDQITAPWRTVPELSVRIITPDEALAATERQIDLIGAMTQNPMPYTAVISGPSDQLQAIAGGLSQLDHVDGYQLDEDWIKRWNWLVGLGQRGILFISIILLLGAIATVGNTIGLTIISRKHEIEVMTLVGATRSFIRRPFLYYGVISGILGALMSLVLFLALVITLYSPWQQLLHSYQIPATDLPLISWVFAPIMGVIIGTFGALVACSRYLDKD